MAKVRVAILGGTGYVGMELIRILSRHPEVSIECITSESKASVPLQKAIPELRISGPLALLKLSSIETLTEVDVVFACLPNGSLPQHLNAILKKAPLVINLAGDFRLKNKDTIQKYYPDTLNIPQPNSVYTLPELLSELPRAGLINISGCMSAATIYALFPLCKMSLIEPYVVADLKSGSSGGGKDTSEHPAERAGNVRPHKLHGHRHGPEIAENLEELTGFKLDLQFSTHSLDIPRGVYASVYSKLKSGVTTQDVRKAYYSLYRDRDFIRYLQPSSQPNQLPMLKAVLGTNVVEVAVAVEDGRCVAIACLDNLVKGAAGQAVQAFDAVHGFKNTGYLILEGMWP